MNISKDDIANLRGGYPHCCDWCGTAVEPGQLEPDEADTWVCHKCIEGWEKEHNCHWATGQPKGQPQAENRAVIVRQYSKIPPYVYENLKTEWPKMQAELKEASDAILKAFMAKLDSDVTGKPALAAVIRSAFEVGFVAGASFIKDNPDL